MVGFILWMKAISITSSHCGLEKTDCFVSWPQNKNQTKITKINETYNFTVESVIKPEGRGCGHVMTQHNFSSMFFQLKIRSDVRSDTWRADISNQTFPIFWHLALGYAELKNGSFENLFKWYLVKNIILKCVGARESVLSEMEETISGGGIPLLGKGNRITDRLREFQMKLDYRR